MSLIVRIANSKGKPERTVEALRLIDEHRARESGQPLAQPKAGRPAAFLHQLESIANGIEVRRQINARLAARSCRFECLQTGHTVILRSPDGTTDILS